MKRNGPCRGHWHRAARWGGVTGAAASFGDVNADGAVKLTDLSEI
jgi:hypothetical protein